VSERVILSRSSEKRKKGRRGGYPDSRERKDGSPENERHPKMKTNVGRDAIVTSNPPRRIKRTKEVH